MKPRIILVSALIIMPFSYSDHVVYPIIDPSKNKVTVNSSSFTHSILDTNNSGKSHSFFSTGPLTAYTAQSNGTSPSGCKLIFKDYN